MYTRFKAPLTPSFPELSNGGSPEAAPATVGLVGATIMHGLLFAASDTNTGRGSGGRLPTQREITESERRRAAGEDIGSIEADRERGQTGGRRYGA